METIIKLNKVAPLMDKRPKSNMIYQFFCGAPYAFNSAQIKNLKEILESKHDEMMVFIDDAYNEAAIREETETQSEND